MNIQNFSSATAIVLEVVVLAGALAQVVTIFGWKYWYRDSSLMRSIGTSLGVTLVPFFAAYCGAGVAEAYWSWNFWLALFFFSTFSLMLGLGVIGVGISDWSNKLGESW